MKTFAITAVVGVAAGGAYGWASTRPPEAPTVPPFGFLDVPASHLAYLAAFDPALVPTEPDLGAQDRLLTTLPGSAAPRRERLESYIEQLERECGEKGAYPAQFSAFSGYKREGDDFRLVDAGQSYSSLSGWADVESENARGARRAIQHGRTLTGDPAFRPFLSGRSEAGVRALLPAPEAVHFLQSRGWSPLGLSPNVTHVELELQPKSGTGTLHLYGKAPASGAADLEQARQAWSALPALNMALVGRAELLRDWLQVQDPRWSGTSWARLTQGEGGGFFGLAADVEPAPADSPFRSEWNRWLLGARAGVVALCGLPETPQSESWDVQRTDKGVTLLSNVPELAPPAGASDLPALKNPDLVGLGRFLWGAEAPQTVTWTATREPGGLRLDFSWQAYLASETEPSPAQQGPELEHYRKTVTTILAGH